MNFIWKCRKLGDRRLILPVYGDINLRFVDVLLSVGVGLEWLV